MSKPTRMYTAEFKRDASALAERGDRSVAQIERDLGLSAGCLRHWRADARRAAAAGTTTEAIADHTRELQRLRREHARLREEREILKKPWPWPRGHPRTHRRPVSMDSQPAQHSFRAGAVPGSERVDQRVLRLAHPTRQRANDGRSAPSDSVRRLEMV